MNYEIAIIGLGYVGLPLAVEFSKKYKTYGYDINNSRVEDLRKNFDETNEISEKTLKNLQKVNSEKGLEITSNLNNIKHCNFYIITVPTPVDKNKRPDLSPLINVSKMVGSILTRNNYVIYESTVYPGVTEDICLPYLEHHSNLKLNEDFFLGYSPERINPGDKIRKLKDIKKVTSGSNKSSSKIIDDLYNSIIDAGTHLASSIKVAEASKVIENSQRDVNIAFVNELSKIFSKLKINTHEVLEAASTKWNFLKFKPGLVGGHCIGVDPYYLAQKAEESGYYPEMILTGRRINDSMGEFIASEIIKKMALNDLKIKKSKCLLLGFSFKENCPDFRNTKVIDIYKELISYGLDVSIYDPLIDPKVLKEKYNVNILKSLNYNNSYELIILAVAHNEFLDIKYDNLKSSKSIVYDIKGFLPKNIPDFRL
tara:strand:+ start:416 stop:1693 length:1278 start_codon:yes stop_codon:yes gene_type:complete